ncbi:MULTISPECIES: Mor transcription activator family protein [unclassified Serratia (in: enterobacteria)]|uniref:Mor transcription activator family protein n=1 Tax=unclassified Serratia (in: enterobacteria) TaxID=2647522 RepID=UPI0006918984|nr:MULTISPECIES: Mor transcription activator family protein [unclassified Serratia (in: enterobacteria)]
MTADQMKKQLNQKGLLMRRLVELAGNDVASRVAYEFGGQMVYIPFGLWLPQDTIDAINQAFTGNNHMELARQFRVSINLIYHALHKNQQHRIQTAVQAHQAGVENGTEVHWAIPVTQQALPDLIEVVLQAVKMATKRESQDSFHLALVSLSPAQRAVAPDHRSEDVSAENQSGNSDHPGTQPDR